MAAQNFCEDFAPRNEAARLFWERGANRATEMSAAGHAVARNFCEDFAPRDGGARLCGERGANRAAEMSAEGKRRRGISVKILLPGTVAQGFAGSGEQIAPRKCRPKAKFGTVARQYR